MDLGESVLVLGDRRVEPRWEKLLCPSNCTDPNGAIGQDTWQGLWSYDLGAIPAFVSAYANALQMVGRLAVYAPEEALSCGEDVVADLEETVRYARDKLSYEAEREDVPDAYERATGECILRLEAIRENVEALMGKVESGAEIDKQEVLALLESLHRHTVAPPAWSDYERAGDTA